MEARKDANMANEALDASPAESMAQPSQEIVPSAEPSAAMVALRSLQPVFIQKHHEVYVEALLQALDPEQDDPPLNIALTGAYGTGKSSVLKKVCASLLTPPNERKTITISLSTLGDSHATGEDGGAEDGAHDVAQRIQKAILQQLLYSEPPRVLRGSRFRRAEAFSKYQAMVFTGFITALAAVLLVATGGLQKMLGLFDEGGAWQGISIVGIVVTVVSLGVVAAAAYFGLKAAHGRFRIQKLSAASATIEIGESDDLVFDTYLDEIVFFSTKPAARSSSSRILIGSTTRSSSTPCAISTPC